MLVMAQHQAQNAELTGPTQTLLAGIATAFVLWTV